MHLCLFLKSQRPKSALLALSRVFGRNIKTATPRMGVSQCRGSRRQDVQVANPDFFLKMVPLMDGGDDVGMVLSPQSFHNLQPHADIFNHANVQFWEYAQHGYDALDFISCTGTGLPPTVSDRNWRDSSY